MLEKIFSYIIVFVFVQSISIAQNTIVDEINNDVDLKNASIGFYAVEANTGRVLVDINSNKNLKPASNLKLLTTIAAIDVLGAETRFETKIMYSGYFEDNTLVGNLYIIGGGDPTFNSKYFKNNETNFISECVNTFNKAHITEVDGDLIIIDTLFKGQATPSTWVWGDIGNYYGAGVSSFAIFDNQYKLYFNTKVGLNDTVKYLKVVPEVNIILINEVTATKTRRDRSNIYGSELCNKRVITGELPINKDSFIVKGSILNPEQVLARHLKTELLKNNFTINGKTIIKRKNIKVKNLNLLTVYKSPTVKEIVEQTNTYSVNVYAEMLLRQIDIKLGGDGTNSSATKNLKKYWTEKGNDKSCMKFYDGSGLSSYNLISAKNLVKSLQYTYSDTAIYNNIKTSLPISGKTGTLKYMFRKTELKGKVYAKSGSMSGVKAYSGYIYIDKENPIIFSLIFNNYTIKSSTLKLKIQHIIGHLSKL